ncbi:MAG TPA: translation elongation factor 4 [Dongiaceae bacterium]|nr:translation elongation factor 4 [Dongiaceae bacterium]
MSRNVRNFCIVAHVDHGKSTLADRLLEVTGTLRPHEMKAQVLDNMDLEREKGITIKSHPITMEYRHSDGRSYLLNLIDTPGHVDFSYEVSRSLAACEGAILVVDAAQGIEAQTLSNLILAQEAGLTIVPVLNKIDLPAAHPDKIAEELGLLLDLDPHSILRISAKTGQGVEEIVDHVIRDIPPPPRGGDKTRALIFDSVFDQYRGVVCYLRVTDGDIRPGQHVAFFSNPGVQYEVLEVGIFRLDMLKRDALIAGDVGYLIAGIRTLSDASVGDTVVNAEDPALEPLPGYKPMKPMVFSGLYPVETEQYEELKVALEKLSLNDSSLFSEPETSEALGFGFRCGFLGPLHLEIVQERLEREYGLQLIATVPNVRYRVELTTGETIVVENPAKMPDPSRIERVEEPFLRVTILVPNEYVGNIMKLAQDRRGIFNEMEYLDTERVKLVYRLPLNEIIIDFYDKLKSLSRGYATLDYEYTGYVESAIVKMDILLNEIAVDALSVLVHRDKAYEWGRSVAAKLKELIPRQMFQVAIQAAVGNRVIARETIGALRKNVTAKCYGGDITRKRKLLEKQREGKRRMKQVGNVSIPKDAFLAVLKVER